MEEERVEEDVRPGGRVSSSCGGGVVASLCDGEDKEALPAGELASSDPLPAPLSAEAEQPKPQACGLQQLWRRLSGADASEARLQLEATTTELCYTRGLLGCSEAEGVALQATVAEMEQALQHERLQSEALRQRLAESAAATVEAAARANVLAAREATMQVELQLAHRQVASLQRDKALALSMINELQGELATLEARVDAAASSAMETRALAALAAEDAQTSLAAARRLQLQAAAPEPARPAEARPAADRDPAAELRALLEAAGLEGMSLPRTSSTEASSAGSSHSDGSESGS